MGIAYVPIIETTVAHFDRYRNMALPFVTVGASVGNFCYPPLVTFFNELYGWRGAILIMGGLTLHLIVFSALLRPIDVPKVLSEKTVIHSLSSLHPATNDNQSFMEKCADMFKFKLLTHKVFAIFLISNFLGATGFSVINVHLLAYAGTLGISARRGAWLFSAIGIGGAIGRLMNGFIAQRKWITPLGIFNIGLFCAGVITMICPLLKGYVLLLVYATLFGLFFSAFNCIMPLVANDMVGLSNISSAFGFILLMDSFGYILGGPLASKN